MKYFTAKTPAYAALAALPLLLLLSTTLPGVVLASPPECQPAGSTGLTALVIASPHQVITGTYDAAGCDIGIYVGPGVTGVVITHSTVTDANDHGIFIQDSSGDVVSHDIVTSNGISAHACIPPNGHPPGCIPEDKAIELVGTSFSLVTRNVVSYNLGDGGIGVSDDGATDPGAWDTGNAPRAAVGDVITDNQVLDNTVGCGIILSAYNPGAGLYYNVVSHNTVTGSSPGPNAGPYISDIVVAADVADTTVMHTTVTQNTVDGSLRPGIIVHANKPGDVVEDTDLVGNSASNNGFFPPPPPAPGNPDDPHIPTGVAVIAEVSPGLSPQPAVIGTHIIQQTTTNDKYGVWLCGSASTLIVHLTGNAVTPVQQCPAGGS